MKKFISKYGGISLGSVYGLSMRIIFGLGFQGTDDNFADLFSITFIWVVPIIMGIIPMIFATKEQLSSNSYRVLSPLISVLILFVLCYVSRLEDLICIIIISIPFLVAAALSGYFFARAILHYRKRNGILYSILVIPFLVGIIEVQIPTPTKYNVITTSIIINSTPDKIWKNVIRVREIKETEYHKGFFNLAGIPRPLYAELDKDTVGAKRIGHFEGGLIFRETVNHWERNKRVSFDIRVVPSSIRQTIFDQHVLKGNHFKFLNASYNLRRISDDQTELTLTSSYQLDTNVNFYGSFWGDKLMIDFQERLLDVIKKRCDE